MQHFPTICSTQPFENLAMEKSSKEDSSGRTHSRVVHFVICYSLTYHIIHIYFCAILNARIHTNFYWLSFGLIKGPLKILLSISAAIGSGSKLGCKIVFSRHCTWSKHFDFCFVWVLGCVNVRCINRYYFVNKYPVFERQSRLNYLLFLNSLHDPI